MRQKSNLCKNRQVYAMVVENERLYTKKDFTKAKLATEFLRNRGYYLKKEAI
jgi:hypothetical protein